MVYNDEENGLWLAVYAKIGFHIIGVDLSLRMLKAARNRAKTFRCEERFNAINADLMNLPVSDNSGDIAHFYGVIEHIPVKFLKSAVEEMKRVLKLN